MSGVTGTPRIESRESFNKILRSYKKTLESFGLPIVDIIPSGSFISQPNKTTFGDMDLIIEFQGIQDKKEAKKILINKKDFFLPFISDKYKGRTYYNSGEIITFNYQGCQIDNIISLSKEESNFKSNFLNLTAETQGLLLGLVKIAIQYNPKLLSNLGLYYTSSNVLEFNVSSKELQLREITYIPDTFITKSKIIIWTSQDWNYIRLILDSFNINKIEYNELINIIRKLDSRSKRRIKGTFNSMVTIKSGEIGTKKGLNKERYKIEVNSI